MKNLFILTILIASIFTSCAPQTATIHQGGTCGSPNCSPSRGSQLRGSNSIVQTSNWAFSLVDIQMSPSRGGGYGGQYNGYQPQRGYQQPCNGYQQPCGYQQQGYGGQYNGYQPQRGYQQPRNGYQSSYYGHSSNPVMVNGVAFSDQYPGGVRVAPSR